LFLPHAIESGIVGQDQTVALWLAIETGARLACARRRKREAKTGKEDKAR
jgi:hypothetical protein